LLIPREDFVDTDIFCNQKIKHSHEKCSRAAGRVEDFDIMKDFLVFGVGFEFSFTIIFLIDISFEFKFFFESFFVFFEVLPETISDDVVDDIRRRIKYSIFLAL
jgi:hypothetical protein